MRPALLALALVSCSPSSPSAPPDRKWTQDDRTRFLVAAIFEGLHEDWPDPALLKPILEERDVHFVTKCPMCGGVFDGMNAYVQLRAMPTSWPYEGGGFPKELSDGLKNPDRGVRLKALGALVDRYITRHFETVAMTPGEKASMKSWLLMGKKYGTTVKSEKFGDYCPSCSGATQR